VKALERRPDVTLKMSGYGWPDWQQNDTALANVRRIMRDADCVYTYKIGGNPRKGVPAANDPGSIADGYLVVQKWQEMWWTGTGPNDPEPAWKQAVAERVGLAILSHANDVPRMMEAAKRGVQVAVIPHAAEPQVFAQAAQEWPGRKIDVLLTGSIGENHYPLRGRWQKLMQDGRLPGACYQHPHPGYWFNGEQQAEARVRDYAQNLGKSKIVLGCTSRHRYELARFPEAAMAGAIHVSDMPEIPLKGYEDFIVPVEADWSDERLIQTVADLLADKQKLSVMSERAQATARQSFTWEKWADRFVDAVKRTLGGPNG
jgi:hypothetical protein